MAGPLAEFGVEIVTPPAYDAVLVSSVMKHCKAEVDDDFLLFADWVKAAGDLVETATGLLLCSQTVAITFGGFPDRGEPLELPVRPVRSITGVSYRNASGEDTEMTGFGVWLTKRRPLVGRPPGGWPSTSCDGMAAVTVTAVAGFATPELIPAQAVQAIKLIVGYWNGFRGDGKDPNQYPQMVGVPAGANRLMDLLRPKGYR